MEQELDSMNLSFLAKGVAPPWLPAPVAEARKIAYWAQWLMLLIGLAFLISGVILVVLSGFALGGYFLACGIVNLLLVYLMKGTFFDAVDLGKFREATDKLVIWMVLGLVFGILGGLMLLIAYLRIKDVFQPNYQPYPSGQYQVGQAQAPPQQYTAPQAAPVAPSGISAAFNKCLRVARPRCRYAGFSRARPHSMNAAAMSALLSTYMLRSAAGA